MANGHGGARPGAGRKKQSAAQKKLHGKAPVKSKGVKLKGEQLEQMTPKHAYMSMQTKNSAEAYQNKYSEV